MDVLVEAVDISSVIEVDIGDFENIAPAVKDVQFRDVGNIAVSFRTSSAPRHTARS